MGAETRVAIAEDLVLDFSGLFAGEPPEKQPATSPVEPPLVEGEYKTLTGGEKPVERLTGGLEREQAKTLYLDAERERERRTEEQERALEICREYQANTIHSEAAQTAILEGVRAGGNPYKLLVTACECIGDLTDNPAFARSVREDIEATRGWGLLEPEALEMELEGIQARLTMLTRPELAAVPEDTRGRIKAAIREHQRRSSDIERVIRERREECR